MSDWSYEAWPSIEPNWLGDTMPVNEWDMLDWHVDLGCGTIKKGRIGIDRYAAPGVNIVMDLNTGLIWAMASAPGQDAPVVDVPHPWGKGLMRASTLDVFGLPFEDSSIKSIITHHALEHLGPGFLPLIDDVYRVLEPGGIFRAITPLFPSTTAVQDADHVRYFTEYTWDAFCGHLGDENNPSGCWLDAFSVPYTKARFKMLDRQLTPSTPEEKRWTNEDHREIRVALQAVK